MGKKGSLILGALVALAAACSSGVDSTANMSSEHRVGGKIAGEVFADDNQAALAQRACDGDAVGVEALVQIGVDVNARGLDGVTPLLWAQNCESLPGVEALLRAGADPNLRFNGTSAVLIAASGDSTELLRLLLSYGGDPNAASEPRSETALGAAFTAGMLSRNWENYELLLSHGADINAEPSVAELAASLNQYDKVCDLLQRGYSFRLEIVARLVQTRDNSIVPTEQRDWAVRAERLLEQRGIRFPVSLPPETPH